MTRSPHPGPEQLLDPNPDADVVAHLEGCAQCRVEARLLRDVFDSEPATLPGIDEARTSMDSLRASLSSSLALSGSFVVDGDPRKTLEMTRGDMPTASLPSPIGPGVEVDHFQVVRALGRGGMGEVFLARDTRLGRKVALKVLRSSELGSGRAVERFLFEARTTARFSHPHIVAIHAVGEHEGNPYVALEYLEGQTLRQRLVEERPGLREVLRIGLAIAEALDEAHRHRVLHRDLKPENVMMPRDGRLRVLDFGLAKVVPGEALPAPGAELSGASWSTDLAPADPFESRAGGIRGTPPYMAPEQWQGEDVTGAADVWALGMILHEVLSGRHPFAGADAMQMCFRVTNEAVPPLEDPELPAELVQLVDRCLDREPARRPGIGALVETLATLAATGRPGRTAEAAPFRGLLPCDERDADRFFGRDDEIAAFLERMRHEPVLPVVGTSGSGKSSFVQAGVIPRLREQARWVVLRLRPGRAPMRALAAALLGGDATASTWSAGRSNPSAGRMGGASSPAATPSREELDELHDELARELPESPSRLALRLGRLAGKERARVLLFVDQLEELYSQVPDPALRRTFLEALCLAADDPHGPVRVIFTLRDDFLGRLALGPAAREALGRVTVLRSPGPDALREILTRPLEDAGYRYDDPSLVGEMVAAVADEPAALPLLQVTGQGLWTRRDREGRLLLRAAHDEMGGVAGALAHHADGVLEGLDEARVDLARAMLLRLVRPEGTRRVLARQALLAGLADGADAVLDRLVQGRLVLVRQARRQRGARGSHDGEGPRPVEEDAELELVHESLVRTWTRLARWIDESREERVVLAELEQAAELWRQRGAREEEVWTGEALRDALRRTERLPDVPAEVTRFLESGQRRDRRVRTRRRALLGGAFAALLVVAAVLAGMNLAVRRQRDRAEEGRAEALLQGARTSAMRGELLEARAQLRSSLQIRDSTEGRTLWWQLRHDPRAWGVELALIPQVVVFSPDGEELVVGRQDGLIQLMDVDTRLTRNLRGLTAPTWEVTISADGRYIAAGAHRGQAAIWDVATGEVRHIDPGSRAISGTRFHPEAAFLATSGTDGRIRLWDPATGDPIKELDHPKVYVRSLDVDGTGERLATGSKDHLARVWDVESGTLLHELHGHEGRVQIVRFSPDGRWLATSGNDRVVRVWDLETGETIHTLEGHTNTVYALAFHPHRPLLASAGRDASVRLWDLENREEDRTLGHHEAWVWSLSFHPDGDRLASSGQDNRIQVWDLDAEPLPASRGHSAPVVGISFHPEGHRLVSAGLDRTVRVWDVASGRELRVSGEAPDQLHRVQVHSDGETLSAACLDHTVRRWRVDSLAPLPELTGHAGVVFDLGVDPGGRWLASGDWQGESLLWDLSTGDLAHRLQGTGTAITGIAFRDDGRQLATTGKNAAPQLWDPRTGALLRTLHGATARTLTYAPGGAWLASANDAGEIHRWDLETGTPTLLTTVPDASVYALTIDPSGERLAAANDDQLARLFRADGELIAELRGHRGEVNDIHFSPDGDRLATGSDDTTVRIWDGHTGAPLWTGDAGGEESGEALPDGVTAAAEIGPWTVHGYRDGGIEFAPGGAGEAPAFNFEDTPTSPVERLLDGPRETLLAGFGDGTVGVWSTRNGARLVHMELHGPVGQLSLEQGMLTATTELGDREVLDLSVLHQDYCELLGEVWSSIPVVWEEGLPVAREPDAEHPCR